MSRFSEYSRKDEKATTTAKTKVLQQLKEAAIAENLRLNPKVGGNWQERAPYNIFLIISVFKWVTIDFEIAALNSYKLAVTNVEVKCCLFPFG